MIRFLLASFFIFSSLFSHAQTYTGFKQLMEFDSTRTFDTIATSEMHMRPVKIDLFYPSAVANGEPLRYGEFLNLYSLRMDYTIAPDSAKKSR